MSCGFNLGHYRELVSGAHEGGYRFRLFDHEPEPGDLFLRHDVDLSLDAALRLAELEAELEVPSTYFLMTRSVFYNLLSPEGEAALDRLRELGHAVGLHAVHPYVDADERFDRVLAWHNPVPETMTQPVPGLENVMGERFFRRDHYRSDSNAHWRSGCPHEELANGEFDWLQLLTHPEIWVYPGETMGQTMRAMLEAERERDLERLAGDRIDLG